MNVHEVIYYAIKKGGSYDVTALSYVTINSKSFVEYVGIAPRGSATSAAVWQIFKLNYTGENVTLIQSSLKDQVFDDRATTVAFA